MSKALVRRMFTVESNMIHKIGFDPATPGDGRGYLVVQFSNLAVYAYPDVPHIEFLTLMNATSVGAAFSTIKAKYKATILDTKKDTHVINSDDVSKPQPKEDAPPLLDTADAPVRRTGRTKK